MLHASTSRLKIMLAVASMCALLSAPAHAGDQEDAIMNATQIATMLDGVHPNFLHNVLRMIETGELKRIAPKHPVWILEIVDGTILYYQGQPEFKGKPANLLVDDTGNRFGMRAVNWGKDSLSRWVTLQLANQTFKAYCRTQQPFVVCSLIPEGVKVDRRPAPVVPDQSAEKPPITQQQPFKVSPAPPIKP